MYAFLTLMSSCCYLTSKASARMTIRGLRLPGSKHISYRSESIDISASCPPLATGEWASHGDWRLSGSSAEAHTHYSVHAADSRLRMRMRQLCDRPTAFRHSTRVAHTNNPLGLHRLSCLLDFLNLKIAVLYAYVLHNIQ